MIKKAVTDAVKKNEKEVRAEMQRIIDASPATVPPIDPAAALTAETLQQALAALTVGGAAAAVPQQGHPPHPGLVPKLTLRHGHILEDINDFQRILSTVKVAADMSDPEVVYYMREAKFWNKKTEDIVASNRKFQEEVLGIVDIDLEQKAATLNDKIVILKTVKDNKVTAVSEVDASRGLNSLCESKAKDTVVFPEPFKGLFGENVFKFKEDITAAIKGAQVKNAEQVRTLSTYLRGDAKARVGEHQPDLATALKVLVQFYGNSNIIWIKYKEDFKKIFSGNIYNMWGELGSTQRVDAIARMLEFIRQAKQYAVDYPELKDEIISLSTVKLLTKLMPMEYLQMVCLAVDDTVATPTQQIETMEDILTKLKKCCILAVNQLMEEGTATTKHKVEKERSHTASGTFDPLGVAQSGGSVCSVDTRHKCHKSSSCQPSWGLLGCSELYKLRSVEERIEYCRISNCCIVCGTADMSTDEASEGRHKRCDYKQPADRFLTKCTAYGFTKSNTGPGKKVNCYFGAALCTDHKSFRNTSQKLLEWLKDKKIRHDMFTMSPGASQASKASKTQKKTEHCHDPKSDKGGGARNVDCRFMPFWAVESTFKFVLKL